MALEPARLRCEYLVDPVAVGTATPRLSWIVTSAAPQARQIAYQIRAASDAAALAAGRADLWDSGRVDDDETLHHRWGGAPLGSRASVWWTVRVWDQAGRASAWAPPARFGIGLLEPADWRAEWIGAGGEPPAGGRDHNGYHSEFAPTAEAVKWVQIDLGAPRRIEAVRLHPARPYNWSADVPGFLFPLRYRLEAGDTLDLAAPRVLVDRTTEDAPNPGGEPVELAFAPVTARFVRLTATRLRERDAGHFGLALAELEVLGGGDSLARGAAVTALDSIDTAGWSRDRLTDGETRARGAEPQPAQPALLLRREFAVARPVRRALLHATARGLYELWLNGRRVGQQVLAPEWTDYQQRIQVQTYDVTALLGERNVLGAVLGDGWFAGTIGLRGPGRFHYGALPSLLCQLELELADGTRVILGSDGSWRVTSDGPVRENDILDGETYDARLAQPGWSEPGFDDRAWRPAAVVAPPAARLVMQPNEPIGVVAELRPVAVSEPRPGVTIADLGQVMVGWARVAVDEPAGREMRLRYGEQLNPDGTLYTDNLRGAAQTDRFISAGRPATWEPRFTYHGFRYVELTGLSRAPRPEELVGRVVCSAAPEVGAFECSEPLLNKLWSAILWTQRGNLHSLPTDCPQRDERLGWMGDIQAFGPTAMANMDLAAFFTKWLADVRDAQDADGRFPDFAPLPPGTPAGNAPAWADAGIILPWHQWTHYADRGLLQAHYPAMRRFIDLIDRANPDHLWTREVGADYSDWLNGDTLILEGYPKTGGAVPKDLFATAFFAHSTRLVAQAAEVLGETADAARYHALRAAIERAFRQRFVAADGTLTGDTQAGYALALAFDLLPAELRPAAQAKLRAALERYGGRLSTGIQSTVRLLQVVPPELGYALALRRDVPSWGYMIDHGGTTIWERWDGWAEGRGFQNAGMNSFCHWAFGSVGEWMVRTILGLRPDEAAPGFRHATIAPRPGGGLTFARGRYESVRGTFAIDWRLAGGAFELTVDIPANTTATVSMPFDTPVTPAGGPSHELGSGRWTLRQPAP